MEIHIFFVIFILIRRSNFGTYSGNESIINDLQGALLQE